MRGSAVAAMAGIARQAPAAATTKRRRTMESWLMALLLEATKTHWNIGARRGSVGVPRRYTACRQWLPRDPRAAHGRADRLVELPRRTGLARPALGARSAARRPRHDRAVRDRHLPAGLRRHREVARRDAAAAAADAVGL